MTSTNSVSGLNGNQPPPTDLNLAAFGGGFTLDGGVQATDAVGSVVAPQLVAQGRPLWMPDATVLGVTTGPLVPPGWRGGAFMIMPGNNPADWTTEDGTPSNTFFVSKNVVQGPGPDWMAAFSRGGVGTWNPGTNQLELGYGGTIAFRPGGVPIAGFLNIRGNPPENFTGTISANFGVVGSLDQAAARALSALAPAVAAIPTPQSAGVAAGMAKASAFLTGLGQGANVMFGAAERLEARFENGNLVGLYSGGQRIVDIEQFMIDALRDDRYRPPVIPNNGNPVIANYNYTTQLAFGTSPWDLAAQSGGLNHGNGAMAVANAWRETIQAYGQRYYDQLPSDVQRIVLFGPRSMADAGNAANALLAVASPGDATLITRGLTNRYNLDFGVPAVKAVNSFNESILGGQRPGDYEFVRNVFEGDYRYRLDNPPPPNTGGFRL